MIGRALPRTWLSLLPVIGLLLAGFVGCAAGGQQPRSATATPRAAPTPLSTTPQVIAKSPQITPAPAVFPVMLGIDVLEADKFAAIAWKKIGLLTHPPGVNRRGESTVDVLRRRRPLGLAFGQNGQRVLHFGMLLSEAAA